MKNKITKEKTAWVVYENTDLMGNGTDVPIHICELKATALRLTSGRVGAHHYPIKIVEMPLLLIDDKHWYGPVAIHYATKRDEKEQEKMDELEKIKNRALSLGLSKEELEILMQHK